MRLSTFSAKTRMSGVNLDGQQIRKGAAEAVEAHVRALGGEFPESVRRTVREIAQAGGTPRTLEVAADVSLGTDPAGGFKLTGIALTVSGDVDGIDAAQFEAAAEKAKVGCPVSKALTGVDITMKVR